MAAGLYVRIMFYVYIMTNKRNGTLYIGHTDDLHKRVAEHKDKTFGGFTAKYGCDHLVWYQEFPTREEAFKRERQLKKWNREWKLDLIEAFNPQWEDLTRYSEWPLKVGMVKLDDGD